MLSTIKKTKNKISLCVIRENVEILKVESCKIVEDLNINFILI